MSFALPVFAVLLIVAVNSGVANAQADDVFWTNYFSNNAVAGAPDAVVRITNPGFKAGARGSFSNPGNGSLCALVYVFSSDQQLAECCGCLITPNGLQTTDVRTQLTSNSLTGVVPNNGVIQIMASGINSSSSPTAIYPDNSPFCDPSAEDNDFPDLRAWGTHIQNCSVPSIGKKGSQPVAGCVETETPFEPTPDGRSECPYLTSVCNFVITQGSGQGVCDCGAFEK